jgi:hypothetical protein
MIKSRAVFAASAVFLSAVLAAIFPRLKKLEFRSKRHEDNEQTHEDELVVDLFI